MVDLKDIVSLPEGTYAEKRYLLDENYNAHLFTLFNENEELLNKWKTTYELPIEELLGTDPSAVKSDLTAGITDDPFEILSGSESHENTLSNSRLWDLDDRRLLGTLLNGKNLVACVKNSEGRIVAQSTLALFIDKDNKPILFKRWNLPLTHLSNEHRTVLNLLAEKKAAELGCPIVTTYEQYEEENNRYYRGIRFYDKVESQKGPGYEFDHALGGSGRVISGNETFVIKEAYEWNWTKIAL